MAAFEPPPEISPCERGCPGDDRFVEFLEGRPTPELMAEGSTYRTRCWRRPPGREVRLHDAAIDPGARADVVGTAGGRPHRLRVRGRGLRPERDVRASPGGALLPGRAENAAPAGSSSPTAYAAESMDIIQESGQGGTQTHVVLFNQAWPAALLGRVDQAREMATTGIRLAAANDDRFNGAWNAAVWASSICPSPTTTRARPSLEQAADVGRCPSARSSSRSSRACRTWSRSSSRSVGPMRQFPSSSAWRTRRLAATGHGPPGPRRGDGR